MGMYIYARYMCHIYLARRVLKRHNFDTVAAGIHGWRMGTNPARVFMVNSTPVVVALTI